VRITLTGSVMNANVSSRPADVTTHVLLPAKSQCSVDSASPPGPLPDGRTTTS
jgi:hypothetical protein